MINSVKHKALRKFIETGGAQGLQPELLPKLKRFVTVLAAADTLDEISSVPAWRLHALKGDLKGYWSVSISGNWRVIFRWSSRGADDIDIVDYH